MWEDSKLLSEVFEKAHKDSFNIQAKDGLVIRAVSKGKGNKKHLSQVCNVCDCEVSGDCLVLFDDACCNLLLQCSTS